MLDRAHLFITFSPASKAAVRVTVLASALALAALSGACSKTEGGASGTTTATATTATAPSASAASKDSPPDAAPAEATANAATDAATAAVAASATASAKAPASAAASASAAPAAAAECGTKPLPDCPLQGWMKANMNPAVSAQDFPALATALDKAATYAPAGYTNWASIAKDGAKAARAQDLTAAKAACRTCHDQYKDKFKKDTAVRAKKI